MNEHDPVAEEKRLLGKLSRIEALFAGAATPGEKDAAGAARDRIRARLASLGREAPAVEIKVTLPDVWSLRLFRALLDRYGVECYRYTGQRRRTAMVKVPKRFFDETLWPEFEALHESLSTFFAEVTDRVVKEVLSAPRRGERS